MIQTNKPFQLKVPGEGDKNCKIAIVGEAPGQHEARERRPFVEYAPAGIAFNQMLQVARIYRPECYVTNVFKQRAPYDNTGIWLDYKRKNIIESVYYKQCIEFLREELSETSANIIIAAGGDALWALCKLKNILERRGSILESTLLPGRKVIPMMHPAATLINRMPKLFHLCVFDLIRARKESEFSEIMLPDRDLIINSSFSETIKYIKALNINNTKICYDFETRYPIGPEITHISLSKNCKEAICICFYDGKTNTFTPAQETEIWQELSKILENKNIQKIGHNLTFDNMIALDRYGIVVQSPTNHFDTMIGQVFVNPDLGIEHRKDNDNFKDPKGGKSLAVTMSMYSREPYYKDELRKGGDTAKLYNAKDSVVLTEIKEGLEADLKKLENTEQALMQMRLIDPLIYMGRRGIKTDTEGLKKASIEAGHIIDNLTEELHELVGHEINPNSNLQLKKLFYEDMKIHPYKKKNNKGKFVSTVDKYALSKIAKGTASRKPCREAKIIQDIRFYTKRKSTYYDISLKGDRILSSFNTVGTKQHRLSASSDDLGLGSNLENQTIEMRRLFLADDDYVAYEIDLRNADARVTAYVAPEPRMIHSFENDIDIYCSTVGMLRNKNPNDVSRDKGTCFICPDASNCGHNERYGGKKTVLGYNYGWGYKDFAIKNDILEKTAKELREKYLAGYAGIPEMWRWINYEIKETSILRNCFDTAYRFLLNPDPRTHYKTFLQGYSYIPQSTVADKINWHGVIYVWENLEFVELLNQVHDSIWFQIPLSQSWSYHREALLSIKRSLEQSISWKGRDFIIPIECKMGLNFGEMKDVILNQEASALEWQLGEIYRSLEGKKRKAL